MSSATLRRITNIEALANAASGTLEPTVYGIVSEVNKVGKKLVPKVIRKWEGTIGNMKPTRKKPTVLLVEKLEPAILIHRKYKCLFGGRGGMKTMFAQNAMVSDVHSSGTRIYVLRERMTALRDSIYSGIETTIKRSELGGFLSVPTRWEIRNGNGGKLSFGGMKNIIDMKGTSDFKYFLMEEAENTAQKTIDTLGPTLRDMPGAELWYLWNTGGSQDPMSKEFITPYQADIDKQGYYLDKHHLIIKLTYKDNPWFEHDDSLSGELEKDRQKVERGIMSESRFNGIWNGMFNDDVSSSVIKEDWFNSCIDAHIKLGFEPKGAKVAACDPSDTGLDPCGYAERHGVVFTGLDEIQAEDGNRKMDEACKRAIAFGADSFGYDADGLGATLRDNVSKAFSGKKANIYAYKGSTEIHDPESEFKSETANLCNNATNLKNKDVLFNKKAQNTIAFAEAVLKTHEAVTMGKYIDPDELISFATYDDETGVGIKPGMLAKLKAEACKMPIKPSNTVRFYTKEEMRRGVTMPDGKKMVIPSPNLFDACVVSRDKDSIITYNEWAPLNYTTPGMF